MNDSNEYEDIDEELEDESQDSSSFVSDDYSDGTIDPVTFEPASQRPDSNSNNFVNRVVSSKKDSNELENDVLKKEQNNALKEKSKNALTNNPAMNLNKRSNDANRLQQALNKKNSLPPLPSKKTDDDSQENKGIGATIDKAGEKLISKHGGKAITAMTGGAVSGPAADAVAKTVAKPVSKMLKYQIIIILMPFLLLLLVIIPVIISAPSSSANDSSFESESGACSYSVVGKSVSNVKVRLLKCSTNNTEKDGEPIDGNLIDFEDYVLGVVNQEIGADSPVEAIKAQAIAVRSYSLTRLKGTRLKQESGQWILEMKACTDDQAYCDPYQGCHSKCNLPKIDNTCRAGGNGGSCHSTIYPGNTSNHFHQCHNGYWNKGPASQKVINAVQETRGQVALSGRGNVAGTSYANNETNEFKNLANQGLNAFEIIKKIYGDSASVKSVSNNCESYSQTNAAGEFTNWKQCNESWSSIKLGKSGKNICRIGCAATSVAIQIANSNAKVAISKLDPGTFVETLNENGGFTSGGEIDWGKASVVAPNFTYVGRDSLIGDEEDKAQKLKNYINNNEYIVIGVHKAAKDGITHWVALDSVSSNTVFMFDPGSANTKLFDTYPYTKSRDIAIRRYKLSR